MCRFFCVAGFEIQTIGQILDHGEQACREVVVDPSDAVQNTSRLALRLASHP
jgi:hypothetical protein